MDSTKGRKVRYEILVGELLRASEDLSQSADARAAIVFLDRLARLEAYPEQEVVEMDFEVDMLGGIQVGQELRQENRDWLSNVLSGIDFSRFVSDAVTVNNSEDDGIYTCAMMSIEDALMLRNLCPWLNGEVALEAQSALDFILDSTVTHPSAWSEGWDVLVDIARWEQFPPRN